MDRRAEEIALFTVGHGHGEGAISEAEEVIQHTNGLLRAGRTADRTVKAGILRSGARTDEELGSSASCGLDEDRPALAVHLHVEHRPKPVNLPQLFQVSGELRWHVLPLDVSGRVDDAGGLVLRIPRAEVGEEPGPNIFRLADIDHAVPPTHHPVDPGSLLGEVRHTAPEPIEIGLGWDEGSGRGHRPPPTWPESWLVSTARWHGCSAALRAGWPGARVSSQGGQGRACRPLGWQRRQKVVARPSMEWVPLKRAPQCEHGEPARP